MKTILLALMLLASAACYSPTEPTPVMVLDPKISVNGVTVH